MIKTRVERKENDQVELKDGKHVMIQFCFIDHYNFFITDTKSTPLWYWVLHNYRKYWRLSISEAFKGALNWIFMTNYRFRVFMHKSRFKIPNNYWSLDNFTSAIHLQNKFPKSNHVNWRWYIREIKTIEETLEIYFYDFKHVITQLPSVVYHSISNHKQHDHQFSVDHQCYNEVSQDTSIQVSTSEA